MMGDSWWVTVPQRLPKGPDLTSPLHQGVHCRTSWGGLGDSGVTAESLRWCSGQKTREGVD